MSRSDRLTKRKDGSYCVSVMVGRRDDGTKIRKYIYDKTKAGVNAKAQEFRKQMEHGFLPTDENALFGQLAALLCADFKVGVSPGVLQRYESIIKNRLSDLAGVRVRDLKTTHLQAIINRYAAKGYSSKTLEGYKQVACQVLRLAMNSDIVTRNVFERVTIQKTDAVERVPITPYQRSLLESTYQGHRMGLPAMFLLYAGLRRGELLALTWRDIDTQAGVIHINKSLAYDGKNVGYDKSPKTAAGVRDVPIFQPLADAIAAAPKAKNSFFVCPSATGQQMTNIGFRRAWESYQHFLNLQAGGSDKKRGKNDENGNRVYIPAVIAMEPFTPHQLRHTFVSLCHEADVDVKSAQLWAGHSDIRVTLSVYTHLTAKKHAESIQKLNNSFAARKEEENFMR